MPIKLRNITLEQRMQIGEDYRKGIRAAQIASMHGITSQEVNNTVQYLRTHGVQIPFRRQQVSKSKATPTSAKKTAFRGITFFQFIIIALAIIIPTYLYWHSLGLI